MSEHGYSAYANGQCRCGVCRTAKADYMRERRAAARALAQKHTITPSGKRGSKGNARVPGAQRHLAYVERHGTRFAYEERGCRCFECTDARTESDRKYKGRAS